MPDTDPLAAELTEISVRNEGRIRFARYTEHTVANHAAEGDVRRLLKGMSAVLEHHKPVQLHGMVMSFRGEQLCGHDADYDGDAHYEGDDGIWYCRDKPVVKVCESCCDGSASDLRAEWPCLTYSAILAGLTRKDNGDA